MPKIFTEEARSELSVKLLDAGFAALKEGGLSHLNVEQIAASCYIAKGTFYHFFPSRYEYLYRIMLHERQRSKDALHSFLNEERKLTTEGLSRYLHWLLHENPNIFSYLSEPEKKRVLAAWPPEYLENEHNDAVTMNMLYDLLASPRKEADLRTACNLMKLLAVSLQMESLFLPEAYPSMMDRLINQISDCICA